MRRGPGRAVQRAFWRSVRAGLSVAEAAASVGVSQESGRNWFREAGGMPALSLVEPLLPSRFLTITDRETIAVGMARKDTIRQIARDIGRPPSTVKREIGLNLRHQSYRSRAELAGSKRSGCTVMIRYSPHLAQARAESRRARPKVAKLAGNDRLRTEVQDRLKKKLSPEQISSRLQVDFPDDAEMRVCHETIYQSLYVQGRGQLRRDLHTCLRTGRAIRKPHRKAGERRGRIPDMILISQRPAEVADRAVPGHWEGDLIVGAFARSAIGTLVERTTRFTMLLHLPVDHSALAVQDAMVQAISRLPATLCKTLTWDQGSEMANHVQIAAATNLEIYFCDPHSPWQRGSNENTNGLLRQYFPKGTDLSVHSADHLDHVAAELNNRPRKTLGWQTPAEELNRLLS